MFGSSQSTSISISSSSESDDATENLAMEPQPSGPLFEGANLTVDDFVVGVSALKRRHNISAECLRDFLLLMSAALPEGNACPETVFTFNKTVPSLDAGFDVTQKNDDGTLITFDLQLQLQTVIRGTYEMLLCI